MGIGHSGLIDDIKSGGWFTIVNTRFNAPGSIYWASKEYNPAYSAQLSISAESIQPVPEPSGILSILFGITGIAGTTSGFASIRKK